MKKGLKIVAITFASLVLLVGLAVGTLLYVVFTPERLTPVVRQAAGQYLNCAYEIGRVELTLFSSFPDFALEVQGVTLVQPTPGAPSDTVLSAPRVKARLDIAALLNERRLAPKQLLLENASVRVFISETGETNCQVLSLDTDTTPSDTLSDPFIRQVDLSHMALTFSATMLELDDRQDTLYALAEGANLHLSADEVRHGASCGLLEAHLPSLTACYHGVNYLENRSLRLKLPYALQLTMEDVEHITLAEIAMQEAEVSLDTFAIALDGRVRVLPEIETDLHLRTGQWQLSQVLALVPDTLFAMPKEVEADGYWSLDAKVQGQLDSVNYPLVDAQLHILTAEACYTPMREYPLRDVHGKLAVHLDLNDEKKTSARILDLSATTHHSTLRLMGEARELLGETYIDVTAQGNVVVEDFRSFLPKEYAIEGELSDIALHAEGLLENLSNLQLEHCQISGSLYADELHIQSESDSLTAQLRHSHLALAIPTTHPERQKLTFLHAQIATDTLSLAYADGTALEMGATEVALTTNNLLDEKATWCADLDVNSHRLHAQTTLTDSTGDIQAVDAHLLTPSFCGYVEYNPHDTTAIPTLEGKLAMQELEALYDTIYIYAHALAGTAGIEAARRQKTQPSMHLDLRLGSLLARMGKFMTVETEAFQLSAKAHHTRHRENVLLEWQPRVSAELHQGQLMANGMKAPIEMPQMAFSYSNKHFHIDTARVVWGESDFNLSGDIDNIGPWMVNKALMEGTLHLTSDYTNINQLMEFTSGLGCEEEAEEPTATTESSQREPYMVPKGVDLKLFTHIREASGFGQTLRDMSGVVYVRNGEVILEEMGFICKAAELQLTALYKTPRRNHLYMGLDYHMTNVHIEELINMIPEVDTMLPMLSSFRGVGEFHLAAETYMDSQYRLKTSTTRGACSIQGKDLTLLDGETFTKIAKILTFKKATENVIDSVSAEITLFKDEIDIYPFLISMDKWKAAVGGQHHLNGEYAYHVSLLSPLHIGVDILGGERNLQVLPTKCRYAQDFTPVRSGKVESSAQDIRTIIRQALTKKLQ